MNGPDTEGGRGPDLTLECVVGWGLCVVCVQRRGLFGPTGREIPSKGVEVKGFKSKILINNRDTIDDTELHDPGPLTSRVRTHVDNDRPGRPCLYPYVSELTSQKLRTWMDRGRGVVSTFPPG